MDALLSPRRLPGIVIAGLAALTLVVYARVWSYGFVFDDANWLPVPVNDPAYWANWAHWARLPWLAVTRASDGQPWAFHGFVVGLHLVNGLLVYRLARGWLSVRGSLVALTLFWLHPIQVEAVAYISGGMEVLLTTYVLIAAMWLLSEPPVAQIGGAIVLVAAATLKYSALPVLGVLPFALGVVTPRVGTLIMPGVVGAVAWHWVLPPAVAALGMDQVSSWAARLQSLTLCLTALWRYLTLIVLPVGFSVEHDWAGVPISVGLLALAALIAVGVWTWHIRRAWAAPWWAWCWIAGWIGPRALVPHAPPLTEHHLYVVALAIWLLAGSAVDRLSERTLIDA